MFSWCLAGWHIPKHLEGHQTHAAAQVVSLGIPDNSLIQRAAAVATANAWAESSHRSSTTMTSRSPKDFARWNKQRCYVENSVYPNWLQVADDDRICFQLRNPKFKPPTDRCRAWTVASLRDVSPPLPGLHPPIRNLPPIQSSVPLINSPQPIQVHTDASSKLPQPAPPKQRRVQCHHHHHRSPFPPSDLLARSGVRNS